MRLEDRVDESSQDQIPVQLCAKVALGAQIQAEESPRNLLRKVPAQRRDVLLSQWAHRSMEVLHEPSRERLEDLLFGSLGLGHQALIVRHLSHLRAKRLEVAIALGIELADLLGQLRALWLAELGERVELTFCGAELLREAVSLSGDDLVVRLLRGLHGERVLTLSLSARLLGLRQKLRPFGFEFS
jgi:hypothetical protein